MDVLEAEFVASATALDQLPPPARAEIAFAGRSNVGKSSLINALCQRKKLVRTSSTPGCTRGINVFHLRLRVDEAEAELDLVDLPGYGFARRSKKERRSWGPLMEDFLSRRPGLRGVVVIVDARRGLEEDDEQLVDFLKHVGRRAIVVATKLDKVPKSKAKLAVQAVSEGARTRVVGFSATTGEGREAVWRSLLRAADVGA